MLQNQLIEKYLSDKYVIGEEELDIINGINQDINNKLGGSDGLKKYYMETKKHLSFLICFHMVQTM